MKWPAVIQMGPPVRFGVNPDVALALGVVAVLGVLVVPVPPVVLDLLLALNLTVAGLVLVSSLLATDALALSSFPGLLLVTTLFRLSLNVSTTRMILSRGEAGRVVDGFGRFVIAGDAVVGLVVFLVITIVQFLVIAKGAERVAEVSARFTLDAMPGKQMSIDAGLRSGAYDDEEAGRRRDALGRESQLYGAMDGAMKFIKGDAVAGLIITSINLVAGFAIGMFRFDLGFESAVDLYARLSIGDGLVSQIPALLITVSAGLVTTKVASEYKAEALGAGLLRELLAEPRVLFLGGGLALVLGATPGLPFACFAVVGSALIGLGGHRLRTAQSAHEREQAESDEGLAALEARAKEAEAQRSLADRTAPTVPPIGLDLGGGVSRALGFDSEQRHRTELLGTLVPKLREALYAETGVRYPGVRVRSFDPSLPEHGFRVRIRDVPQGRGSVVPDKFLAVESVRRLRGLGLQAEPTQHPLTGREAGLIDAADAELCESAAIGTWSPAGVIALHLAKALRHHAIEFIGLQETSELVDRLERAYPALVREVVPKRVSLSHLTEVLRALVEEEVSIRDFKGILEALGEVAAREDAVSNWIEAVRARLSHQIAHAHAAADGSLSAVLLEPAIEEAIESAIVERDGVVRLWLEPEMSRAIVDAVSRRCTDLRTRGQRIAILTGTRVRRPYTCCFVTKCPMCPFCPMPSFLPLCVFALRGASSSTPVSSRHESDRLASLFVVGSDGDMMRLVLVLMTLMTGCAHESAPLAGAQPPVLPSTPELTDDLFDGDGPLKIEIVLAFEHIPTRAELARWHRDGTPLPAVLSVETSEGPRSVDVVIEPSGQLSLQFCSRPKLRIDLKPTGPHADELIRKLGRMQFLTRECNLSEDAGGVLPTRENMERDFLAHQLVRELGLPGLRSRRVNITYRDQASGATRYGMGFFIENVGVAIARWESTPEWFGPGKGPESVPDYRAIDAGSLAKVQLFEILINNRDYRVLDLRPLPRWFIEEDSESIHNVFLFAPREGAPYVIPFDFDLSTFVGIPAALIPVVAGDDTRFLAMLESEHCGSESEDPLRRWTFHRLQHFRRLFDDETVDESVTWMKAREASLRTWLAGRDVSEASRDQMRAHLDRFFGLVATDDWKAPMTRVETELWGDASGGDAAICTVPAWVPARILERSGNRVRVQLLEKLALGRAKLQPFCEGTSREGWVDAADVRGP